LGEIKWQEKGVEVWECGDGAHAATHADAGLTSAKRSKGKIQEGKNEIKERKSEKIKNLKRESKSRKAKAQRAKKRAHMRVWRRQLDRSGHQV
jgi:Zn-finger protein